MYSVFLFTPRLALKQSFIQIAENLYQQGILSYPRTETDQFDPQFDFQSLIEKQTVNEEWGDFATRYEGSFLFRATFQPTSLCVHVLTAHVDYAMAVFCHRVEVRRTIKRTHRSTQPHTPATSQEGISACTSLSLDGSWRVVRRTLKDTRQTSRSWSMGRNSVPQVRLSFSRNPFQLHHCGIGRGLTRTSAGLVILARNYLEVYPYDKWTTKVLPGPSP
jgi:hypothetical protein